MATSLDALPLGAALTLVFVVGAVVGSFLNVCIYRLPLEKSILWPPTSHCGQCLQPIRWYDNIPLVSYWLLGGHCRVCKTRFSIRYFLVELLTGLGFAGLYYLEVVQNVHHLERAVLGPDRFAGARLVIFAYHALLFSFLLVATFADIDYQIIPLGLTVMGTLVGLMGAMLFPWPWPYTPVEVARGIMARGAGLGGRAMSFFGAPISGLQPWPVWLPLPGFLAPGGTWRVGLATGLAGVLAGTMMLRAVRFLFGLGMGAEFMEDAPEAEEGSLPPGWPRRLLSWLGRVGGKTLGLGDADLMMMAGAFLGWQPVLVAFLLGTLPGLLIGVGYVILRGNKPLPFGPALAIGVGFTWLGWDAISPPLQLLFFDPLVLSVVTGTSGFLLVVLGYGMRLRRMWHS